MINSFRNEYAFLSNMFPCNVHGYTCAEAAFQAAKCEDKADRAQFKALDGKEAKALGRKVQLRSDWDTFRTQAMYAAVKCKFTENPELSKKLVATGDEELVEGNDWGDKFWGVCDGKGQNMLGKILMKVRGELGGKGIVHEEDANRKEILQMFKVIIAGSRSFDNYELLKAKCNTLLANQKDIVIVSGCAQGADKLGERYASEMGYGVERHPADWDKYGKSAGYKRNTEMAETAQALIAFWDGESKGTKHMIETAQKKGLAVRVIKFESEKKGGSEVKYEDVKGMSYYMFETLSKLAMGMYTEEELKARREKGKATTLMQAIAEMIVPDEGLKGTYRCYSQRAFDQGNSGDPYEYTGVQISFKLKNGMYITVDTHYGNIQVSYKDMKHSMSMGQKLMSELDKIGEALWADWDDNPDSITKKLRDVEDEETWLESSEDYKYTDARIWSRPTDERNYSKLESEFERDVRGGIKYTNREEDPVAGRNFNYKARQDYKEIIAEQKRKFAESAKRQMFPIKAPAPAQA